MHLTSLLVGVVADQIAMDSKLAPRQKMGPVRAMIISRSEAGSGVALVFGEAV